MALTPEQKELRKTGIGGSEVAAVIGCHPYLTAGELALRKRGLLPEPVISNKHTERGERLEVALVEWVSHRLEVATVHNRATVRGPGVLLATPDGYEIQGQDKIGIVEAKSPGPNTINRWTPPDQDPEGVPDHYLCQVHWAMGVTGLSQARVAVLLGGDFFVYTIPFNRDFFDVMAYRAQEFWDRYVTAEETPPVQGAEDLEWVQKYWPKNKTEKLSPPESMEQARVLELRIRDYCGAKILADEATSEAKLARAHLVAYIADGAGFKGDGWSVSYKRTKDGQETDWKAVALEAGAGEAIVQKHTKTKPGHRRFLARHATLDSNTED